MFTDEQMLDVVNRVNQDRGKGGQYERRVLDAAIAEGLVRPVTVTDAECEELFVFSEGFMDVPKFLNIVGLRREQS
jgi:hypothetical protein